MKGGSTLLLLYQGRALREYHREKRHTELFSLVIVSLEQGQLKQDQRLGVIFCVYLLLNSSDGRVVQLVLAFACGAVDWGLIPSRVIPTTLKLVFILLDAQHERGSVENKPASLLVVPLRKDT